MTGRAQAIPYVTLKDVCWWAYLHPGSWLARSFPSVVHVLEGAGTRLALRLARFQQRRVRARLEASGHPFLQAESAAITDRYMHNSVARTLDDLCLERVAAGLTSGRVSLRGREYLDAALAGGHGALLVSGHFFASRLAKRVLAQWGYPILSVRDQVPPDAGMGRWGRRYLQPRYMAFLHEVIGDEVSLQDEACSLKILRRLREGGLVNIHLDVFFAVRSVPFPFLGRMRPFSVALAKLSQLSGAPVLPFWFGGSRHQLVIEFEAACTWAPDPRRTVEELVRRLEQKVLEQPDQYEGWMWLW
jgi:lauroyl/myristoyl acyltransferase